MEQVCIDDASDAVAKLPAHVEGAIAALAAAMILADEVVDPDEIAVAYEQGEGLGVGKEAIDQALQDVRSGNGLDFRDVLAAIQSVVDVRDIE